MVCKKCGSNNVTTQVVQDIKIKNVHHGFIWWMLIGWWWIFVKWMVFTIPALIFAIFGHKKQKIVTTQRTVCVCQACGNTWNA